MPLSQVYETPCIYSFNSIYTPDHANRIFLLYLPKQQILTWFQLSKDFVFNDNGSIVSGRDSLRTSIIIERRPIHF